MKKPHGMRHYKIIKEKIMKTDPLNIGGFTGDLTNMETLYLLKNFLVTIDKSKNLVKIR